MALFRKVPISKELEALKKNILKDNGEKIHLDDGTAELRKSVLVTYSLSKKDRSKKMLFNYELIGRNGKDGLLQILNGKKVASGCVIIPSDKEVELEIFLNRHEIAFSKVNVALLD